MAKVKLSGGRTGTVKTTKLSAKQEKKYKAGGPSKAEKKANLKAMQARFGTKRGAVIASGKMGAHPKSWQKKASVKVMKAAPPGKASASGS